MSTSFADAQRAYDNMEPDYSEMDPSIIESLEEDFAETFLENEIEGDLESTLLSICQGDASPETLKAFSVLAQQWYQSNLSDYVDNHYEKAEKEKQDSYEEDRAISRYEDMMERDNDSW
jgi:hypothetical protein